MRIQKLHSAAFAKVLVRVIYLFHLNASLKFHGQVAWAVSLDLALRLDNSFTPDCVIAGKGNIEN